jgi:TM2 domain-containing membrane protein YozV
MSKKALFGGLIMILLLLIGLFGDVTMNGEPVNGIGMKLVVSIIIIPIFLIVFGFVFGFIKDALLALGQELKSKVTKKKSVNESTEVTTQ